MSGWRLWTLNRSVECGFRSGLMAATSCRSLMRTQARFGLIYVSTSPLRMSPTRWRWRNRSARDMLWRLKKRRSYWIRWLDFGLVDDELDLINTQSRGLSQGIHRTTPTKPLRMVWRKNWGDLVKFSAAPRAAATPRPDAQVFLQGGQLFLAFGKGVN